jgi:hypothetical protein
LLQYFINYNMKKGYYLTSGPTLTANWNAMGSDEAASGDDSAGGVWTVPFGGGMGRIMRLGPQPINGTIQFYGNAVPAGSFAVESQITGRSPFIRRFPRKSRRLKRWHTNFA